MRNRKLGLELIAMMDDDDVEKLIDRCQRKGGYFSGK